LFAIGENLGDDRDGLRMPEYETLLVDQVGPVGWLVFDRPEAGNAMNATMMTELEDAWHGLDSDPDVRVIVNTGSGEAFQTGLDVAQLGRDPDALREQSRRTKRFELGFTAWHNGVTKPVIAAVNGVCAGGGLHFVADADIVVAASTASFLDPHVSVGQASVYETIALAKKSPMESVLRLAFAGRYERMSAVRAYELGICSEVVDPPEQLRPNVQALAEAIAQRPPELLAATKRALWGALEARAT
jgi:enoyl-CoA hydratase/carnithine racemase